MIYLIEGPDGAGKSTLIKQLKDVGFIEYNEVPRNWPYQYQMYKEFFTRISELDKPIIIDRSFISELVYRTLKNDRRPNITLAAICDLLRYPVAIIYCNNKNAFKNAMLRGETYVTNSKEHKRLTQLYDIMLDVINKFTDTPVIKYDWEKNTIKDLLTKIGK